MASDEDTPRRQAEEALAASESRYQELLASSPVLTGIATADGTLLYANAALAEHVGVDAWELAGMNFLDFVSEAERESTRELLATASSEQHAETLVSLKESAGRCSLVLRVCLYEEDEEIPHLILSAVDVTAQIQAQRELEAAHHAQRQIMAALPSILVGLDPDRSVNQWNSRAESHLGIRAQDAVGCEFGALEIGWDREEVSALLDSAIETGESVRSEDLTYRRPDGSEGLLGISLNPIQDGAGALSGVLLLGADVTDSRHLQEQLANAQKLESIGQLAAGIAHEINTPTQYVGDNVKFLAEAFDDLAGALAAFDALLDACEKGEGVADRVAEARKAVEAADLEFLREEIPTALAHSSEGLERVSTIVKAMKSFSHPGTENRTNVNLNDCIQSTATVASNEWKYVANLELDLDPALPLVSCLPGELNQVFLNMIVNAAHAIEDVVGNGGDGKGTIRICTRADGDHVEICISDSGAGMPDDVRQRIFDPFFTTKGVGKGTGQGLAIAHRVVAEDHAGSIQVSSEPGRGTEFRIRIPIGIQPDDDESEVIG